MEPSPALLKLAFVAAAIAAARAAAAAGDSRVNVAVLAGETVAPGGKAGPLPPPVAYAGRAALLRLAGPFAPWWRGTPYAAVTPPWAKWGEGPPGGGICGGAGCRLWKLLLACEKLALGGPLAW